MLANNKKLYRVGHLRPDSILDSFSECAVGEKNLVPVDLSVEWNNDIDIFSIKFLDLNQTIIENKPAANQVATMLFDLFASKKPTLIPYSDSYANNINLQYLTSKLTAKNACNNKKR